MTIFSCNFIHLFSKYLFNTYYVPDFMPCNKDIIMNMLKISVLNKIIFGEKSQPEVQAIIEQDSTRKGYLTQSLDERGQRSPRETRKYLRQE